MTRDEAKTFVLMMRTAYPSWKLDNATDIKNAVDFWCAVTADIPLELLQQALYVRARTNKSSFPPVPAELLEEITFLENPDAITAPEAWSKFVIPAIRNSTYNVGEEYQKLPPDIQKAVGGTEQLQAWARAKEEYIATTAKADFERAYHAVIAKRNKVSSLPKSVREALPRREDGTAEALQLPSSEESYQERSGNETIPMPSGLMEDLEERLQQEGR